ncbi:unnamed protein product [Ophioblennius macclurei]
MVDLWERSLIVCLLTGVVAYGVFAQTRFNFVNSSLSWTDAQSACRSLFTDLATVESAADVQAVVNATLNYTGKAWIGLHDDLLNSWTWSLNDSSFYGEGEAAYRNWLFGEPNNFGGRQYCAVLGGGRPSFGMWDDLDCRVQLSFVCFNGTANGIATFVRVDRSRNWTEAQRFCRENFVDLASIRNQTENDAIESLANGTYVWIGLRRQKIWSDGSSSPFRNWDRGQPDSGDDLDLGDELGSGDELCVATSSESGLWSDEGCSTRLPFVCHTATPPNPSNVRSAGQNETAIVLEWSNSDNLDFILRFNGAEAIVSPSSDVQMVTTVVPFLTAATEYTFTVFSVLGGVRSSGVDITAATAPPNPPDVTIAGQNTTSVTLQWSKLSSNVSFILRSSDGIETLVRAPDGDGPVTVTVSSLSPSTRYTFFIFSVFENIASSGVFITAVTEGPRHVVGLKLRLSSAVELSQADIQALLDQFVEINGAFVPQLLSVKIKSVS